VTLRRSPLATEESFRLLVDGVQEYAIFMLDPEGHVISWNAGAERIKGYRPEEILGTHFSRFYSPDEIARGVPTAHLALAVRDGRTEDEGYRVRKDGSRFWANVIISALRDEEGRLIGFAKVTRDLTERKRVADDLARAHAELETFSYSISHDLRAPLRAITGYAQALLEDHGKTLDADGRRMLHVVRDSATRMGQLIDGLLTFSRVGRQELKRETLDMTGIARSVVEELRLAEPDRALEVVIATLPPAAGDATLIRQVFANLVANAFKFSAGRPDAEVRIGARQDGSETVYFVRDNGAGFDMRYADKLFAAFARLHGAEFPGTGIGLALVHRIVQRHGGRIWAESAPNTGATFSFTVPPLSG
jgi:PAS domain S-box-containing protein